MMMDCRQLQNILSKTFSDKIIHSFINHSNELYIEVALANIRKIAIYIYDNLKFPLISMFANDERDQTGGYYIYYTFADRENGLLSILKVKLANNIESFPSLANEIPCAAFYEREIHDLFGLVPEDHPDLRMLVFHGNWPDGHYPLRKDFDGSKKRKFVSIDREFTKVYGDGVYEIPVGPVHAGIIEPGHFRFSVAGEPIINLEAQLYFVHKGIEKMCEGQGIEKCLYISERISGDESFTNSLAYCQCIEKIAGVVVPKPAKYIRTLFAELERVTSHMGDLSGICDDVAFGFAASQFKLMRIWSYQVADLLCGVRFLRGVNKLGGVRKDYVSGKEEELIRRLKQIKQELIDTKEILLSNGMFMDRVEHTGILETNIATDLNATGPAGRSGGVWYDVRKAYPYAAYDKLQFDIPKHNNGDVCCRMNVKLEECLISLDLMIFLVENMPKGDMIEQVLSVPEYKCGYSMTESPRGENVHWVMTGENNTIFRYKIRTASFCNWPAVCCAVKGNTVTDFPLINKSFNLSYAGNDL